MRCRQNGSILHVTLQVPKLLQSDPADIHNIVTLRDGGFGVAARNHGAQRRDIARQRFVQGEQADILGQNIRHGRPRFREVFLVCGDVFRVQRRNFE